MKDKIKIKELVRQYYYERFGNQHFRPGVDWVPVSGKAFGPEELEALVECALDFWLTAGPYAKQFEEKLANILKVPRVCLTNSGSSANLLCISALCSNAMGDKKLKPGDEVITSAVGFPTTLNPILQNGLTAVLVDIELGTYNPRPEAIEEAITEKTRAVILAHTLGNPFDAQAIRALCDKHGLFLIEDACDALGAKFNGRPVGSWGDLASFSFYPAHHITTGEGGAVACSSVQWARIIESLRDWGRHCWCEPGHDNTCGRRYNWKFPGLPEGYDHKYVYSEVGYNLKMTDLQAAIGLVQLERLDSFAAIRQRNFKALHELFSKYEDWFILPCNVKGAEPSWFGYPVTIKPNAPFARIELLKYLEEKRIGTRLIFGGNLTRQPAYQGHPLVRVVGPLTASDIVLNSSFWLGVCQAIDGVKLRYMLESIMDWLEEY
ncbi:MAG TPA: lipopolysaccharide biosynthesis protein RfbH [Syntrophomonadaceae bacterium]|nr:lipopolysaccharide biosynthesis protein RfbH [Syntrophomonadaceae bacterium]